MMLHIYHDNCSKKPEDTAPEYKWGGFSMAGHADYICEACGDSLMLEEESDADVLERNFDMNLLSETLDKNNIIIKVGDYARFESFNGDKMAGVVVIISEKKIGINTTHTHYSRKHEEVEKISSDEFMLYKLEN